MVFLLNDPTDHPMADAIDPDSSRDSSSSSDEDLPDKERSWYAQQWNVLCEELGTSDPTEVLARVQTMKREMKRVRGEEQSDEEEGLVTISEVEEVFREMNQKMEKLRERNTALVKRLEEEDEVESPFQDLHQQAEELLDTVDAATMEEARERIQKLNQRLEDLYQEKEQLAQTGFSDADEAVDEIEQLREERDALRRERDRLQADRNRLEQQLDAADEPGSSPSTELDASLQEAAVIMRDKVGVSSPPEAEAFVQIVKQIHNRIRKRGAAHDVDVDEDPDDAVGMLRSITEHLDELPDPETLPAATASVLGVNTTSEARTLADTIRRLGTQIAEHYEGVVELENVDLDTDDASTLLRTLEDQLQAAPDPNATTNGEGLPPEVGDILGIRSIEDARELEVLIADMSDQIERLNEDYEKLDEAGLTADEALAMIENMEVQLADLYHGSDAGQAVPAPAASGHEVTLDDALQSRIARLTDADSETFDDISEVVRTLTDRVDRLSEEREMLAEAGLDVNEALTMIESMEAQLNDLYRLHDEETKTEGEPEDGDVADRLAAIEDVLGISTREEAEELSQIAREMEDQLTVLYQEKEKLEELGLSTIEDAVDMIKSMEDQLTELYEDKASLLDVQFGDTEDQSTFQQLEFLYAEREKMQQALGVSSADEIIEMVEGLNAQLDELYKGRDAEVDPEERYDVLLWEPDAPEPSSEDSAPDEATPGDSDTNLTMNSMEHQLESLYREKETLLHHGFGDAQEAVSQLQMQQKQIDALQRENHTYEQRFERLQSEFGTAQVSQIVEVVEALESKADASLQEFLDLPSEAADAPEYGLDIEAASPFVDSETLDQLGEMSSSELDDLDVGVVCLSSDGTVQSLNEAAFQLPGLPSEKDRATVVGKNFFSELAPSTNNNLFYGRFQEGQRQGEMDARFPYTFTSPDEGPQPFAVHLYRRSDGEATWLLYRPT